MGAHGGGGGNGGRSGGGDAGQPGEVVREANRARESGIVGLLKQEYGNKGVRIQSRSEGGETIARLSKGSIIAEVRSAGVTVQSSIYGKSEKYSDIVQGLNRFEALARIK